MNMVSKKIFLAVILSLHVTQATALSDTFIGIIAGIAAVGCSYKSYLNEKSGRYVNAGISLNILAPSLWIGSFFGGYLLVKKLHFQRVENILKTLDSWPDGSVDRQEIINFTMKQCLYEKLPLMACVTKLWIMKVTLEDVLELYSDERRRELEQGREEISAYLKKIDVYVFQIKKSKEYQEQLLMYQSERNAKYVSPPFITAFVI